MTKLPIAIFAAANFILLPIASAENTATTLHCQTMSSFKKEGRVTVLPIQRYKAEIRDREKASLPYQISGTDFSFTVVVGFTANPDIDDESGTFVGKRTLRSLVAYNSNRSQMARVEIPVLDVAKNVNLTLGGNQPPNDDWRIHVYCGIK